MPYLMYFDIFQNYIQHNKDWNNKSLGDTAEIAELPELHPAQQGLKPWKNLVAEPKSFFQNYIQHNKDWNSAEIEVSNFDPLASRTTSSTTRIETIKILLLS